MQGNRRAAFRFPPKGGMPEGPVDRIESYSSQSVSPRRRPLGRTGTALAGTAAALAAAALYNAYRARRAERRHPPAGRFVTVDGARLHYLDRGPVAAGGRTPVVLIHGNVVIAEDFVWSGVFDRIAERRRVVAFDRPGYGYSDRPRGAHWTADGQADLLRRAWERLGIERPVVVGHSWGALVALSLALNHPDAVGGLVLLSGYYRPTARIDSALALPSAVPVVGDVLRHTISPLLGRALLRPIIRTMFAPNPAPERFTRQFPKGFPVRPRQIRAQAQDGATMIPTAAGMQARYAELRMPLVVMAGTRDEAVDCDSHSRWLHEQVPHSELRLVEGAGHMVHYDAPERAAEAVEAVCDRAAGPRATGARRETAGA